VTSPQHETDSTIWQQVAESCPAFGSNAMPTPRIAGSKRSKMAIIHVFIRFHTVSDMDSAVNIRHIGDIPFPDESTTNMSNKARLS